MIFSREETYGSTKHFGSFLYWEFVDGTSSVVYWVGVLYILKFFNIIEFTWLFTL